MYKKILSLVTVAMMGGVMVLASGQSAVAKTCTYQVVIQTGPSNVHAAITEGKGAIKNLACKRAKKKCQKKAKQIRKQHGIKDSKKGVCKKSS